MDEDDKLPEDTFRILQEFLKEKAELDAVKLNKTDDIEKFRENWQLSQFWYDDRTKLALASACQSLIKQNNWSLSDTKIGLLSCPSLFAGIKNLGVPTYIFEYDQRFSSFGDNFVFYDYSEAEKCPGLDKFDAFFDIIIADPPFLSEECIEKMGKIVSKISKEHAKVVLCSGKIVKDFVKAFLGLEITDFEPTHTRNLGNEFASFSNFDLSSFIQKKVGE